MSDVKSIVDQLNANKDEIQVIQSNIDRCDQAAVDLVKFDDAIARLLAQRKQISAEAFIAGVPADTAAVDKQISDTRAESSSARDSNEAAKAAKEKLQAQLNEKLNVQADLKGSLQSVVLSELRVQFNDAENNLNSAMLALKEPLCQMMAIAKAISNFGGNSGAFGIIRIYMNGLKTGLLQRNNAAIGGFAPQMWIHSLTDDDEFSALMSQLIASGVPVSDIYA